MSKLAIIVPYRDRPQQLRRFVLYMKDYMQQFPWIEYEIIIVEQADTKKFNRGKLLNVGFIHAEARGHHYVIFHDVDLLPMKGSYEHSYDVLQLANQFDSTDGFDRTIQRDYFGGVTLFPIHTFRQINGYSNKYRGWGFEDNDLLLRCRLNNIDLDTVSYKNPLIDKDALKFNGANSYVQIQNKLSFARPLTFVCSFTPSKIFCDSNEVTDEYAIFGIPGYDLNLSYNSFSTYKFELFLTNDETISIVSKFLPDMPQRAVVLVDPKKKKVEFYLNGKKIYDSFNSKEDWNKASIRAYKSEPYLYLGAAAPNRKEKPKFFKGAIDSFAVYNKLLSVQDIREDWHNASTKEDDKLLTDGLSEYQIEDDFHMYFDSRYVSEDGNYLIDLSKKKTQASLHNVKIEKHKTEAETHVLMPKRRKVRYQLLSHKEGGYKEGYWVDWNARINQCYYHSLNQKNDSNFENDGLSNCKYKLLEIKRFVTHEIIKIRT